MSDDEEICLSAETEAILKAFLVEKSLREKLEKETNDFVFEENWVRIFLIFNKFK